MNGEMAELETAVAQEVMKGNADKAAVRARAVLDLLRGRPAAEVSAKSGICRSDLYKFRKRALAAIQEALKDKKRGPRALRNRLGAEKEEVIQCPCERHPTLSSYEVKDRLGAEAPCARTIQRVRHRLNLPRLKKRSTPSFRAHRFTDDEKRLIRSTVESKLYLGPYRLAWDLQNEHGLNISPSTARRIKRAILDERNPRPAPVAWRSYERKHPHSLWHGDFFEKVTLTDEDRTAYQLTLMDDYSRAYVYCHLLREPTQNDTIRAMITAMRQYQTIPKGVIFDNGSQFKGYLLSAFCTGPEAISSGRAAEILTDVTGRRISYVSVSDEDVRQGMLGAGMSEWLANLIIELYDVQGAGQMAEVSPAVEQITGRKPISFAQFAEDYKEAFKAAGGSPSDE
jgi:transposase InsO family protein